MRLLVAEAGVSRVARATSALRAVLLVLHQRAERLELAAAARASVVLVARLPTPTRLAVVRQHARVREELVGARTLPDEVVCRLPRVLPARAAGAVSGFEVQRRVRHRTVHAAAARARDGARHVRPCVLVEIILTVKRTAAIRALVPRPVNLHVHHELIVVAELAATFGTRKSALVAIDTVTAPRFMLSLSPLVG